MTSLVIDGCQVLTMNQGRDEFGSGHVVVADDRITAVGAGPAPASVTGAPRTRVVSAGGCLATPGLVNTHHHLYQWVTRGLATRENLFGWLTALYPVWARLDAEIAGAAATAGLAALARSGCTSTMDHHYVFPRAGGDVLDATIEAARAVGLRFHPTRGSMDLGASAGGLPPDDIVEDTDEILAATQDAIRRYHDPSPGSMLRLAVAPTSPFSVTQRLMREAAELARSHGVRLHTHLAETVEDLEFSADRFGCSPAEYADSVGWLGPDVWLAHAVHLDDAAIARFAATGTGVAHCPSSNARLGAGIARVPAMVDAGMPVGLGVDGAASNEASSLLEEVRHAVLFARAVGGPGALGPRAAVELATTGGARVLGRADEIGSLEPGKLADIALWRMDTPAHAGITDPVAGLVLGAPPPLELLLVGGRAVVERGRVVTIDEEEAGRAAARASAKLLSARPQRARLC
jgi:cytosine/adenosine deaminase-related metal-dependent hydrolase